MDWKLELVVVPVADIDRAKRFVQGGSRREGGTDACYRGEREHTSPNHP